MDKWLNNKNVIRVLSLFLAILLWAVVNREEQTYSGNSADGLKTETIPDVRITVTGLDVSKYYLKSMDPSKVKLVLTGLETEMSKVDPKVYKIVMDLNRLPPGSHNVRLTAVDFPPGVHVEIVPSTVTVVIEPLQNIEVPVKIRATGKPKAGYVAGPPVVTPEKVQAVVPQSVAARVHSADGQLAIDQADADVVGRVVLTLRDKDGREIEGMLNPKSVDVKIPVSLPQKKLPLRINLQGEPAAGYSVAGVQLNPPEVKVFAPEEVLDTLEIYGGLTVDVAQLTETKTFEVPIPLREGIIKVEPKQVLVTVEIVPSATKSITDVPISVVGLKEGAKVRFVSPANGSMDVTLEGAPNALNGLGKEDVKLFVDVSRLPSGKHELPLGANLPPHIRGMGLNNAKVTVEIIGE